MDHIAWHTHVLRPHAVLCWPVMLCNVAFANAMFSFARWPKSLQRGGWMCSTAAHMLCRVQIRGRGQWLPAEEQLPCQVALHSCQLARLLALMTRPPCQHPAPRRTAQQRPPMISASAARPGKECALSMPLRYTVLHTACSRNSDVLGWHGGLTSRPGRPGGMARFARCASRALASWRPSSLPLATRGSSRALSFCTVQCMDIRLSSCSKH